MAFSSTFLHFIFCSRTKRNINILAPYSWSVFLAKEGMQIIIKRALNIRLLKMEACRETLGSIAGLQEAMIRTELHQQRKVRQSSEQTGNFPNQCTVSWRHGEINSRLKGYCGWESKSCWQILFILRSMAVGKNWAYRRSVRCQQEAEDRRIVRREWERRWEGGRSDVALSKPNDSVASPGPRWHYWSPHFHLAQTFPF